MKMITLKLYSFNELEKESRQKALTTYRDVNIDFDWWDDEFEDFIQLCSYLGITVIKDSIHFRGFYAQGDGSVFSASVDLPRLVQAVKNEAWKCYAPLQEFPFRPIEIDRRVMALLANNLLPNEPQLFSKLRQYGIGANLGIYVINHGIKNRDNLFEELEKLEDWLRHVATVLNSFLYQCLEKQYEFLTSDKTIKESILLNEYLFTADGRSANLLLKLSKRTS
jgi:hypothetical protein